MVVVGRAMISGAKFVEFLRVDRSLQKSPIPGFIHSGQIIIFHGSLGRISLFRSFKFEFLSHPSCNGDKNYLGKT